jgi:hypothetical protein
MQLASKILGLRTSDVALLLLVKAHEPFEVPGHDLDYGPLNLYWHTPYDTAKPCSAASLAIVAAVVLQALSAIESQGTVMLHYDQEVKGNSPSRRDPLG